MPIRSWEICRALGSLTAKRKNMTVKFLSEKEKIVFVHGMIFENVSKKFSLIGLIVLLVFAMEENLQAREPHEHLFHVAQQHHERHVLDLREWHELGWLVGEQHLEQHVEGRQLEQHVFEQRLDQHVEEQQPWTTCCRTAS